MPKQTQRTTWYDEPIGEVSRPSKCPDCSATLKVQDGRDYCWFCEKEVGASTKRVYSPGASADTGPEPTHVAPSTASRLADILEDKNPIIKGNIVFDEEDDAQDAPEDDDAEGMDGPAEAEIEMMDIQEDEDVPEIAKIEVYEVTIEVDFELDESEAALAGEEEESAGPDENPEKVVARPSRIVLEPDTEDEGEDEEWGVDEADPEAPRDTGTPGKDQGEDAVFDGDDGEAASCEGEDGGDEFVIDEVEEEDDDDAESPYARGKKKKFVNVL
jgi:hypothetical protein